MYRAQARSDGFAPLGQDSPTLRFIREQVKLLEGWQRQRAAAHALTQVTDLGQCLMPPTSLLQDPLCKGGGDHSTEALKPGRVLLHGWGRKEQAHSCPVPSTWLSGLGDRDTTQSRSLSLGQTGWTKSIQDKRTVSAHILLRRLRLSRGLSPHLP